MIKNVGQSRLFLVLVVLVIACANPKDSDHGYPEIPEGNQDASFSKQERIWLNKPDTIYCFGQGNDLVTDWNSGNFDAISEDQFLSFQKADHQFFRKDTSIIFYSDSLFTLQTSKARLSYHYIKTSKSGEVQWTVYNGFMESIKMYLITHWQENSILTGGMLMIDSISNIAYSVISVSDGPTEIPVLSYDEKYLMIYSCNYNSSNITILERDAQLGIFSELTSFSVPGVIRDVAWSQNNMICFKLDYQNYFDEELSKIGYYCSVSPVDELKWN